MRFPRLFSPGRIGRLEVRNRIIESPMERNYCTADGRVTQRYIDYLEARARGGTGAMYTEATYVDPRGRSRVLQMGLHSDDMIPGLRRLTQAVHRHGARIGPELNYGGRVVNPEVSGLQPWAPSPVPCQSAGSVMPRAFDRETIRNIVQQYAAAAGRAIEAGFDFIGLHGAHGYLLSQFLSPYCNKRDDEYGGDLPGRLRFPLEVIAAVRRVIGPGVPLLYRMSGDEHVEGGLTNKDVCEIAPHLEAAGIDLLDISAGTYESGLWIVQPMEMPQGVLAPLARAVRAHVRIPVSVAGRITDPSVAEHLLEAEDADYVTLGRALHADPDFANKAREGRLDEICTCIACNQGCIDMLGRHTPVVCVVNTTTGREREYAIRPAQRAQRVVVVGAGPAGLESARILALRGHAVTVFERATEPGGQLLLSRLVPGRQELAGHVPWLTSTARRAGVRLVLGVEATVETILDERPDLIVIATGARPGVPGIPGLMDSPAVDAFEVLRRPVDGIRRALVIGGGVLGVGTAHVLAERGVEVVVTETGKDLAAEIGLRPRWLYVEHLLERPNVTAHLGTTVEALGERHAVLWNGREQWEVKDIDLVVPTRPMLPATDLAEAMYTRPDAPPVFLVGDCVQPRTALEAIHEAAALAHRL